MVEPFNPKLTPLELEKTSEPSEAEAVPAETVIFAKFVVPGPEMMIVLPDRPPETNPENEKFSADSAAVLLEDCAVVLPSAKILAEAPAPEALAVMVEPLRPKLTPLLFEKTMDPRLLLVVPALKFGEPPPPAAPESARLMPALLTVIEPEMFVPAKVEP